MKHFTFIFLAILFISIMSTAQSHHSNKPKVTLNHQAIFVTDLKKSATFYKDIIGLEQVEEPFKIGKHAWFKTGPKTTLHIILGADTKKEYFLNNHMCFSVSSLDAFLDLLKKNNIQWADAGGNEGKITTRVDGVKQLWIKDPDNYWIEINNDQSAF